MKKLLLIGSFLTLGFIGANAQQGFTFGAGIRLGMPIGDFSDTHSFGVGAEVQGEYGFSEKFSGIFTTGYTSFFGKEVDLPGIGSVKYDATGLIPILAGVRVYPAPKFFIGAQAGYGILTGGGSSEGAFSYQPQIGYNGPVQIALNYNGLSKDGSTLSHIGLTAVYKFGGDK